MVTLCGQDLRDGIVVPRWMHDVYSLVLRGNGFVKAGEITIGTDDIAVFPGSFDTKPFAIEFQKFAAYRPGAPVDERYISIHEWIDCLRNQ